MNTKMRSAVSAFVRGFQWVVFPASIRHGDRDSNLELLFLCSHCALFVPAFPLFRHYWKVIADPAVTQAAKAVDVCSMAVFVFSALLFLRLHVVSRNNLNMHRVTYSNLLIGLVLLQVFFHTLLFSVSRGIYFVAYYLAARYANLVFRSKKLVHFWVGVCGGLLCLSLALEDTGLTPLLPPAYLKERVETFFYLIGFAMFVLLNLYSSTAGEIARLKKLHSEVEQAQASLFREREQIHENKGSPQILSFT